MFKNQNTDILEPSRALDHCNKQSLCDIVIDHVGSEDGNNSDICESLKDSKSEISQDSQYNSDSGKETFSDDQDYDLFERRESEPLLKDDDIVKTPLLDMPSDLMVYEEPEEYRQEHELHDSWTMYFRANKPDKSLSIVNITQTNKVCKVGTVEGFWQMMNHMKIPKYLQKNTGPNLMFFRNDIKPEWEDIANVGGGMWGVIFTSQNDKKYRYRMDELWFDSLLAIIGETLPHSEYITGLVLQKRSKEDRLQLWTRDAANLDIQKAIGLAFKNVLDLDNDVRLCFTNHSDMMVVSTNHRSSAHQKRWTSKVSRNDENNFSPRFGKPAVTKERKGSLSGRNTSYSFMLENFNKLVV